MELVQGTSTGAELGGPQSPQEVVRLAQEDTDYVGLVVFLGSWTVMFAALFFGYALYRVGAHGTWPPPEFGMVPLWLPVLNTGVIVASSIALERARRRLPGGDLAGYRRLLTQCGALAAVFVALQVWLWANLWAAGVTLEGGLQGGQYTTYMYVMTAFHALHVLVGLGFLGWLGWQSRAAAAVACAGRARLVAIYWHFVGVAWLLMFVLLFVV